MNTASMQPSGNRAEVQAAAKLRPWRLVFRIVRWSMYVAAAISLIMVFHAVPPPVIVTSPQAAARVDQKVEAVEQAVSSGQPATLRLDQTELNSYLSSHLDISPAATASQSTTAAPLGPNSALPTPPSTTTEQVEQV